MPAPWNSLPQKVETGLKKLVDELAIEGLTVNTGIDDDITKRPLVICACETGGEEIVKETGVFNLTATVQVVSKAPDTKRHEHQELCGKVFDAFITDSAASDLSAAVTDFYAYQCDTTGLNETVEDNNFVTTLTLDIVACGSDIA